MSSTVERDRTWPAVSRAALGAGRVWAGALPARAGAWLPKGHTLPRAEWEIRHRWLLTLLWAHALALPIFALARGYSPEHSLLEGSVVVVLTAGATFVPLSQRWRAAVAATALITSSAMLVHFSGGTIEAHFHFFVVVLILALYEDWVPFLIALAYVVLHHGIVGTLSPGSVYNHQSAVDHPWRWALVHGAFIGAAAIAAIVSWRLNELSRTHAAEAVAQAVRSEGESELKSRFIAVTSHELRTPLTSIGGFATTLSYRWEKLADADRRRMVEIIEAQAERLSSLIDDLLVLATLESGRMPVHKEERDVRSVLERSLSGLTLNGDVSLDVSPGLRAELDERHVAQIVVNFLTNAQKYGRPPIVVSARRRGARLELAVADTGDGVPAGFVPRLFDPFTRADEQISGMGTGLGLSVVRGLAEAHGGEVWYEPNLPRGARFVVGFPVSS